ncbi:hypothetical protein M378DRAFT_156397 [Amanita muscaria Koide BX008]|uniref:Uncharacterized protein n=1 Tax=Amanita muscaria (strain Koide BX008) TaxID=946122 RepID=A0A0C2XL87_AMAMK|nr:hypothetical protein M378DRAFT_156397 [Amanita muscaria Koide BX008]
MVASCDVDESREERHKGMSNEKRPKTTTDAQPCLDSWRKPAISRQSSSRNQVYHLAKFYF